MTTDMHCDPMWKSRQDLVHTEYIDEEFGQFVNPTANREDLLTGIDMSKEYSAHRCTGTRRGYDPRIPLKHLTKTLYDDPRLLEVTGIKCGLAAAGLILRIDDWDAVESQKLKGSFGDLREELVHVTGNEKCYLLARLVHGFLLSGVRPFGDWVHELTSYIGTHPKCHKNTAYEVYTEYALHTRDDFILTRFHGNH